MSPATSRIVRGLVSAGLLAYLLWRADAAAIWATVRAADPAWLVVAFLLHVPGYLISAVRWRLLLLAQRIRVPLRLLLASYLVGTFFNQLLPTTIGGDLVRVYDTAKYSRSPEASFLAVVVERLTGILALAVFALVGLVIAGKPVAGVRLTGMVALMLALTLVPLWLVWYPRLGEPLLRAARRLGGGKLAALTGRVEQALACFGSARGSLGVALGLAFVLQVTVVIHFYLIAQALDLPLPFGFFFLVVPVATFVLMLPVSINGIGVREGIYALFFSEFGIPVAGAIAFVWLGFAMVLVYAAVGGLVYAVRK
ncbi:MAG TPA: lysylphosphatidylglycerol synthase transmembrane domain-containing protein [Methylomirabilota bacterium]|nr:lysylphosphatidylglycerol synthase transmembrane domain-containing protein [Methylomirabilota bacterium]